MQLENQPEQLPLLLEPSVTDDLTQEQRDRTVEALAQLLQAALGMKNAEEMTNEE